MDITNFVLMEYGQPLHSFDFDTLSGRRIVVRKADPREQLTTLDGQERNLTPEMLSLPMEKKGWPWPGLWGSQFQIQPTTKNILLESAFFEPRCIRRTAKKLGLSSEASTRFERGVDIEGVIKAADRAALLIRELAGGEIVSGWIDEYPQPLITSPIHLNTRKTGKFLGIEVTTDHAVDISRRLGMTAVAKDKEQVEIIPPSFRRDLTRPVDLMEEVARLIGYDRIPATIPNISSSSRKEIKTIPVRRRIREILTGLGFDEIITYSFISEEFCAAFRDPRQSKPFSCVRIKNPISEDQSVMRTSLIPGLLTTMNRNWAQRNLNLRFFELGNVFTASTDPDTLPEETNRLSVLWTGRRNPESHYFKSETVDFYDLKGVLENLADSLKIKEFSVREAEAPGYFIPDKYLRCYSGNDLLGEMGQISPRVQSQFDLKETAFVLDLDVDLLSLQVIDVPQFKPWPRFPETTRDMALILDNHILWTEIQKEILSLKEPLIEEIELFDLYSGKPIPEGKKNLGVRIHYRSAEKTLSDEQVNPIQDNLLKRILEKFGATLRER